MVGLGRGGGGQKRFLALFCALGPQPFFFALFALFCASLHPLFPQFALFSFVPYMDKFMTRPVVAEEDENDDDGCPELEDEDSENDAYVQEPDPVTSAHVE